MDIIEFEGQHEGSSICVGIEVGLVDKSERLHFVRFERNFRGFSPTADTMVFLAISNWECSSSGL
jgi:hypothetical protein